MWMRFDGVSRRKGCPSARDPSRYLLSRPLCDEPLSLLPCCLLLPLCSCWLPPDEPPLRPEPPELPPPWLERPLEPEPEPELEPEPEPEPEPDWLFAIVDP